MKIALLTSGGDAPGMNACLRSVVRYALSRGIDVYGFHRGYQGVIEDDGEELVHSSVSNMVQRGGTFLQTERCDEFRYKEYREIAAKNIRAHGCDCLIVIGGDGSMTGARELSQEFGIQVVGIPGTIDNDLAYTDFTLGFDTAVNNVVNAINILRDTMQSHNKVTFLEVMGRRCGDIALHAGIAGGAEYILVPEVPFNTKDISDSILAVSKAGKKSNLVILAEGAGNLDAICAEFQRYSGLEPRRTRLGHIQRGGSPTYRDRMLAAQFGIKAVQLLEEGKTNRAVGIRDGHIFDIDIKEALSMKKQFDYALYESAKSLT